MYCRADSAYLCSSCDAQVHAANRLASRHERVRVCQSCERAPAAFFCKADAASLCTTCDSEIHSANPLARRHQRVPILPISEYSYSSTATNHSCETTVTDPENRLVLGQEEEDEDEAEAASWLLPNSGKNSGNNNGFSIGDEFLNLVDYSSSDKQFTDQSNQYQLDCNVPQRSYGEDGVVPLQIEVSKGMYQEQQNFQLSINCGSWGALRSSNGSLSHMVNVSSMDLGVVPESTTSDATVSNPRSPKAVTDQPPYPPAQMLSPRDREARVLRYREKKKMRKFEKTIRYASRKAYAEKRPRIKGRFAKKKDVDEEANQAFSTMITFDTGYGIVPSF